MRIIGGEASGRRLRAPQGSYTRPTGDRVREALFNIWQGIIPGCVFLDGYAGTGAMGLEALSRGAAQVTFCEPHFAAMKVLKDNVRTLGYGLTDKHLDILPMSLEEALKGRLSTQKFDVIFCDPPWDVGISNQVEEAMSRMIYPGGMVVIESRASQPIVELPGLSQLWTRRYGDTRLTAYQGM